MPRSTVRISDVDVDEDTLFDAMEEARTETPPTRGRMLASIAVMVAFGVAAWVADRLHTHVAWTIALTIVGAVALLAIVLSMFDRSSEQQRRLYIALSRRGIRLCVSCAYDLRGLGPEVSRCPECGAEREVITAQANESQTAEQAQ